MPLIRPRQYLEQLSRHLKDVFFLEIGAMDGKSFDLLFEFVRNHNWKGILVEPLPDMFAELRANYAGCEGLIFENVAIAEDDQAREIYRVPADVVKRGGVPGWVKGISSIYKDRNAIGGMNGLLNGSVMDPKIFARFSQHIVREEIACTTLEQLISRHDVERIDVLQIDTEGYDYQVFRQLDFARFRPFFIKVEVGNLPPEECQAIVESLTEQRYRFEQVGLDILAVRELDETEPPPGQV